MFSKEQNSISLVTSSHNKHDLPKDIAMLLNEFSQKESERSCKISSLSREIQNYLLKISLSEGKEQLDLVEKLRSLLFQIYEKNYDAGQIWVRDTNFREVVYQVLHFLADTYPINLDDPISLMPIEEDDKITFLTGQQFSLSNLIQYNKERFYRGNELGETDKSKFLINPLTNKTFPPTEVEQILFAASKRNLGMTYLADKMINNDSINSGFLGFFTLNQTAQLISTFSHPTQTTKTKSQDNSLPICKIERDEWDKKDGYFEKFRSYLIENNNCIRRITIYKSRDRDSWDITLKATKKNRPACDSIFNFCAERNGLLEKTLIKNGLDRNHPCVRYFPDGDNIWGRSLDISGNMEQIKSLFPVIIKTIKDLEGEQVFTTEPSLLNLLDNLDKPEVSMESTQSSYFSNRK